MTQIEYLKSGCDNRHSKFTFKNGEIAYGLITTFFHNEHDKYYLVRSPQMIEFKKYMDSNDHKKMKESSSLVNLEDLASAELLDSFGELLVKKKSEEEKDKVDWEKRKTTWLNSVDDLYKIINTWLSPFQKEGLLNIKEKQIDLSEEYIGSYKAKRLEILLGNDIVTITPRGTLVIGSFGRLDMRGPKGEALLVETDWNDWKFAKRTPKMQYWNLTEQSFKEAIQEIING
jgi:hypothetical protein